MNKGLSLIELMIVLAITAILMSFTYPSYQSYMIRSHRLDGKMALFDLAHRMETYFTHQGTYQLSTIGTGNPNDVLSSNISPQCWYDLTITQASDQHYTLQATPRGTQAQQDTLCQSLELNDQGMQSIRSGPKGAPTGTSDNCWS